MATEAKRPNSADAEAPPQPKSPDHASKSYIGSVRKGKLWCDCEPARRAICRPSSVAHSKGKKFWACPKHKDDPGNCHLFYWDSEVEAVKAWLVVHGPPDPEPVETPVKPGSPKDKETPWTKAKRKPISREVSGEERNANGGPSEVAELSARPFGRDDDGFVFVDDDENGEDSPSRKAAKRKRVESTGGGAVEISFADRLRAAILPTPETMGKGKEKAVESPDAIPQRSPTRRAQSFDQDRELVLERDSDSSSLATKIICLLREERGDLKESTQLMIRHEIGLVVESNVAKIQRYEETISIMRKREDLMRKREDELETTIGHLTGIDDSNDGCMSQSIAVSD